MRGHIVKRGKNSYSIKVSIGKDSASGKYKYQWTTVKGTKKEAEKHLADLLHQLDTGTFMKPGKTTVTDYLHKWLTDYAEVKLSPRGFERYSDIIRQHLIPAFGNMPLTQLKPEHLQKHYAAKLNDGRSARTVRYHHAVIHKALQTALKWGLVSRNVADGVDLPPIRRTQMQTWDDNDINRFLEAAKESRYYALFYTALFTGMRRSELLGLAWRDVDFLYCQLSVTRSLHHLKDGSYIFTQPKSSKSRRTIALSPSTMLLLKEHKEKQELERATLGKLPADDDLVFSTLEGKPLRPNTITRAWVTLTARAGVKAIRLHDARHTHASIMLKQGVHPKIVQERLGHSSIEMTLDIYSHVMPGLQEAAAKRFDDIFNHKRENEPAKSD